MGFHEVRFPDTISRGARGGPERRTQVVELASGIEERNASWANSRRRYDVAFGIRRADDLAAVVSFFEARNGRLHGFRFKDWADYKSCLPSGIPSPVDQLLGAGDATRTTFQLVKRYISDSQSWTRVIAKPVAGSVVIALGGAAQPSGWSVDLATGLVTFTTAPGAGVTIHAGFEFDVPVRFDTDTLDVTLDVERLGSITSIPLMEIRMAFSSELACAGAAAGLRRFRNTSALRDTITGYGAPLNDIGGRVLAGPHEYEIIAAAALDQHLTALSGLKLKLTPENNIVVALSAFGVLDDGRTDVDCAPALQSALDWLALRGGGKLVIDAGASGTGYYLNASITVPGGTHVECQSPLLYGPHARFTIQGKLAEYPNGAEIDRGFYLIRASSGAGTTYPDRIYLSNAPASQAEANFAVGDLLVIRGENDASGTALTRELAFVSAVVGGTGADLTSNYLVLDRALATTFEPDYPLSAQPDTVDYTTITKRVACKLTAPGNLGDSTLSVTDASLFRVGDFVLVQDFAFIEKIDGPSTNDRNLEGNQVTGVDVTGNTITLTTPLAQSYSLGFDAIVGLMRPVVGAKVTGARVRFTDAQSDPNRWVFWMAYAIHSGFEDCTILTTPGHLNEALAPIGQLAQGFRIGEGCVACHVDTCRVLRPAYVAGGLGYGVAIYDGARFTRVSGCHFDGCRHSVLEFKGATNSLITNNVSVNCLNSDFDAHGGGESGSVYAGNIARWGPDTAPDVDVKAAFRVGNPVHLAGASRLSFLGNRIEGFPSQAIAFDIQAPCDNVSIIGNHALNCGVFAQLRYNNRGDALDAPTQEKMQSLAIANITISDNTFTGPGSERFLDLDGGPLRAVSKVTLNGNVIQGVTCNRQVYNLARADQVTILDDLAMNTIPGASNTLISFSDVTNLRQLRQTVIGADKVLRVVDCPGALLQDFVLSDVTSRTILRDEGGNTNLRMSEFSALDFHPKIEQPAPSTGRVVQSRERRAWSVLTPMAPGTYGSGIAAPFDMAQIAVGTTLPASSEGRELFSITFNPSSPRQSIRYAVSVPFVAISATGNASFIALLNGVVVDAFSTRLTTGLSAGNGVSFERRLSLTAIDTAEAQTLSVRLGASSSATLTLMDRWTAALTTPMLDVREVTS